MAIIAAFDPGLTTGWCLYSPETKSYHWGQLDESLVGIRDFLNKVNPDIVVYEDFKHRPQMINAELYSVQVIGVLRLWSQDNDKPTFKYLPATAKAFWQDDKIKALGLWQPGRQHSNDATRVMLKYRMDTEPEWFTSVAGRLKW